MDFKKILFSLKSKKTKQHENKNETTFSKMDNNSSNKVSYIDELKDKYRKNNYNNIPYIKNEKSAEYVLNNWNTSAPVPRAYMKNQTFILKVTSLLLVK